MMAVRDRRISNVISSCDVAWLSQVHNSLSVRSRSERIWLVRAHSVFGLMNWEKNGLSGGGSVLYAIQSWLELCSVSGRNVDSSCFDRWSQNCSIPGPAASSDQVYPSLAAARVFWSYLRAQPAECHPPAGSKRWYRRAAARVENRSQSNRTTRPTAPSIPQACPTALIPYDFPAANRREETIIPLLRCDKCS